MPIYYLYSHALELTMKAFLRTKKMPARTLAGREWRHSLLKLWEECGSRGLTLNSGATTLKVDELIRWLDPFATDHEFRYLKTGYKTLPP